ncbi:MAG: FtsQ-type POTRA domain-containing protein [Actinobacteria bacterium]|nr:MAG: FtsQ-type POTRA domain-containing protein [Actinomycetota bacterium]
MRAIRGRRLVATMIVASLTIAAGSLVVSRSSLLRLRHLEVVGTSSLTRAQVVRLAALSSSTNVLWFDAGAVERRLESDPWVATATVSRRLPGTIRISVVERAPVAMIRTEVAFTLLAADGVALGTVAADPMLPEIVVMTGSSLPEGNAPAQAAARAIAGLDGGRRPAVVRAVVDAGALSVELDGGTRVEFGDTTGIEAKTAAARQILRWATTQGASVASVNVTAPDSPAVTLG